MRNSSLINRRNKLIYAKYAELWGQGLREELIWPELVLAFHLERDTIYRIVLKQSKIIEAVSPELPLEDKDAAN
ncbi:hypothetical protein [Mucilaginibacter lappiensis]|uniref:Uncharacterized protein n=1 Tax=Mucilaginibacter lappiensis TaxID=354630 RepID=A0A841JP21_9SPHI|nr:hypothetical protein [Mucilaginibacter lappiensis]MBB6131356.1 hypothetical protein [Mucilaginibacter lappiensis]